MVQGKMTVNHVIFMNNDKIFDYWNIKERRYKGESWKVIATDYNTNKGTISKWFKETSLSPPPKIKKLKYDLAEIQRLKEEEDLTWDEIGELHGVQGNTICNYYYKYAQQSNNSANLATGIQADKKTIVTQRGEVEKEFEFVRVDDCFKCPVCGKKKRASKDFCSTTCRWIYKPTEILQQVTEQITQPVENSTLLIQSLLTSTKQEDSPK